MLRNVPVWLLVALVAGALWPGCSCGDNLPAKSGIGPKTQHQLSCSCRVTFTAKCHALASASGKTLNDLSGVDFDLCLPPPLNTAFDAGADQLSDSQYVDGVVDYCNKTFAANLQKQLYFMNSDACGLDCLNGVAEDGTPAGIFCTPPPAMATVANDICDSQCDTVPCVLGKIPDGGLPDGGIQPNDAGIGNCDPDKVVSEDNSTVHPEFCKCNQAGPDCNGDTTDVICRPPPGNVDPPHLSAGILTDLVTVPNLISIDHASSVGSISVHFSDGAGIDHSDTRQTNVQGTLHFYGHPCPGAECDMAMDMSLLADDVTFHFSDVVCGITCLQDINAHVSRITLTGGTGTTRVHINADGTAQIPIGALHMHAEGEASGIPDKPTQRYVFDSSNQVSFTFVVDWSQHTFSLPTAPVSFADGTGTMALSGKIVNEPPLAVAPADQTLECTSPAGATATLDGSSSSDPDGDALMYSWWNGEPFQGVPIASDAVAKVTAPLGVTSYHLQVMDKQLVQAFGHLNVTVRDTTPPDLSHVAVSPACLWPADHRMVLFTIGDGLNPNAADACDATPSVRIVNVTSNEGSGGPADPDVRFGSSAFCVRAERDGTGSGRTYTVTLEATDSTGNTSTGAITVTVPHSQAGVVCPRVDRTRVVEDDDPRCVASSVPAASPRPPPQPEAAPAAPSSSEPPTTGGCSTSGASGPAMLVLVLLLLGPARRRRARHAMPIVVVAVGLSGCGTTKPETPTGWWQMPQNGACACPTEPECQGSDCVSFSVRGLLANGQFYDGQVDVSFQLGTMSTFGMMPQATWSISNGTITIVQPGIPDDSQMISVSGNELHFGALVYVRPPANLSAALDDATSSGAHSWKSFPIAH